MEVSGIATFTDDTITNNDIGVIVESTGNATIGTGGFGNDISDNTTTGIEFTAGSSGSVSNNFIQGNGTGVLFDSGFTGSMTVVDNNISGQHHCRFEQRFFGFDQCRLKLLGHFQRSHNFFQPGRNWRRDPWLQRHVSTVAHQRN